MLRHARCNRELPPLLDLALLRGFKFLTYQRSILLTGIDLTFFYTPYPDRERGIDGEVGNDSPQRSRLGRVPAKLPICVKENTGDRDGCITKG